MAYHKKNLLEAFQASAAAEKAKAQEGATPDAPVVGGPFARHAPEHPAPEAPPRAAWRPDGLQRLIALQVLITVAAFFLGRASVSTVGAGESPPSGRAPAAEPGEPAAGSPQPQAAAGAGPTASVAAQEDPRPGTADERALFDPRNRYTVKLVEYQKGRDDELALETLAWLQGQGLPAVAQFKGSRLFLLLGAAETQGDLGELLTRAKTMNGPPPLNKPAEFHDAFVVGIDRLGIR